MIVSDPPTEEEVIEVITAYISTLFKPGLHWTLTVEKEES